MTARTHDRLYLDEDRYDDIKESFKFTLSEALNFAESRPARVLDVGSAAGEFSYFLKRVLPGASVHGIDVMPELVEKARVKVPGATFSIGSVLDAGASDQQFDMTFLVGVHSIFDEIEPWLSNLLSWTKPGGTVAVFGLINTHPIDVYLRVRTASDPLDHREPGWNNFSRHTFERVLSGMADADEVSFSDFIIPIDLAPHTDDALRSWTEKRDGGERFIVNGIGRIHDFKVMCIRKHSA